MRLWKASTVCVFVLGALSARAAAENLDVAGLWMTPDHASVVEIKDCGDGTPCGVVTEVYPDRGAMTSDDHNREESLRGRDMVGVTLLNGFHRSDDSWRSGSIYNPKNGRTYRARIELLSHNALAVSGCLGPICKKLVWERVDDVIMPAARELGATEKDIASR